MGDLLLLSLEASTHRGSFLGAEGEVGVAVEVPKANTVSQVLAGKRELWTSGWSPNLATFGAADYKMFILAPRKVQNSCLLVLF